MTPEHDALRKWLSRAWTLVAATWMVSVVALFMGKTDFPGWAGMQVWLVPGWLALDAWRTHKAGIHAAPKE